jgi:hypothetical protein
MQFSRFFFTIALLLAPVALIGTTWLYLYPIFHGCAFPTPPAHIQSHDASSIGRAPFRLLALGDPQLEGDSSLPDPNAPLFPSLRWVVQDVQYAKTLKAKWEVIHEAGTGVLEDSWKLLKGRRKAIDLWGNDWYLAHIVRQTRWWSDPTHVSVLGDLLGSQWITDGEFEKRAGRYWGRVMRGLEKVPGRIYGIEEEEEVVEKEVVAEHVAEESQESDLGEDELAKALGEESQDNIEGEAGVTIEAERPAPDTNEGEPGDTIEEVDAEKRDEDNKEEENAKTVRKPSWGGTQEMLGADVAWANRVINIAGNHDVGYAGDLDIGRIARFEKAFGSVNWDIWFTLPRHPNDAEQEQQGTSPALRIVVLNSMNIDAPAWNTDLQTETYSFMNHIITTSKPVEDKTHATLLLTHIPLEKQTGVCVDSPYFDYFDEGQGLKEQNMLSEHSSKTVLEGVFGMSGNMWAAGQGMGRRGIVVNGHDHEGCDVVHFIRQDGVNDHCDVETVKRGDAYWPPSPPPKPEAPRPIEILAPESFDISPSNPFIFPSCPAPPTPIPEPEPEEQKPLGWRAHPFPHRSYSITHNPSTNTSSCTRIESAPHIREITLRSMMGDFSGHAGFLSAWFDQTKGERGEWVFEFGSCGVGVQHWWWGVHSVDFAMGVMVVLGLGVKVWEMVRAGERHGDVGKANGNGVKR